jgi:hypothetical protein
MPLHMICTARFATCAGAGETPTQSPFRSAGAMQATSSPTLPARWKRGQLKKTLASTNPIESMIEIIRRTSRNVKHWQSGDMCLRWTAAGMLEAETQFRRVVGYSDLAKLAIAVERDLLAQRTPTHNTIKEDTPTVVTV